MKRLRTLFPTLLVGVLAALLVYPLVQRSQYYQHVMVMTMMAMIMAVIINVKNS